MSLTKRSKANFENKILFPNKRSYSNITVSEKG